MTERPLFKLTWAQKLDKVELGSASAILPSKRDDDASCIFLHVAMSLQALLNSKRIFIPSIGMKTHLPLIGLVSCGKSTHSDQLPGDAPAELLAYDTELHINIEEQLGRDLCPN